MTLFASDCKKTHSNADDLTRLRLGIARRWTTAVKALHLAGRHLARRFHRQLQYLAERGQVLITRTTVIGLPKIDTLRADADLFSNLGNR
jgi:hypothetical protein